ncbi:MAG TPA: hypothetical protein DCW90_17510 [Lachnospiraceae bacterium]|nr:hypothetical protein [Lachnospiraceae bacterium]
MTIQEIERYLKKHHFLIFKYQSAYYTLMRSSSRFCNQYTLIATDTFNQQRNSLEELCEQVYICNGTLLGEAIKYIEIPKWEDVSWETYEAVRHSAIVHGNEIHFFYKQRDYWIAHASDGSSHLSDDLGNTQRFSSCRDLFRYARIDGKTLKDIWEDVSVDAC